MTFAIALSAIWIFFLMLLAICLIAATAST